MIKRLAWIGLALALVAGGLFLLRPPATAERFTRLMSRGNGFLERGDNTQARALYQEALRLSPENTDVLLNLANACLAAGQDADVIRICRQVLALDHNSAAAYYLTGCACLNRNQPESALQAFQQSQKIDPKLTALDFQLGLAQARLGQVDEAIRDFERVVQFEPDHPSAHYQLSRLYGLRGRSADAARELRRHQQILAKSPGRAVTALALEQCLYTQPRIAFVLAQPARRGIPVKFADATGEAFGAEAARYGGPLTALDYDHDGRNSLFVLEAGQGFRLLDNRVGHFHPLGRALRGQPGAVYRTALAGDLDNDGVEDVVELGGKDSQVFKFYPKGRIRDATRATRLESLQARGGLLADLNFTGNLDLLTIRPDGAGLMVNRNLGNFAFDVGATDPGLPTDLTDVHQVLVEDWNNDGVPGVFIVRPGHPPVFFARQRAGHFVGTMVTAGWPDASVLAIGDLNNDLHPDAVLATGDELQVIFSGGRERAHLPLHGFVVAGLKLVDYDNDGWLDLIAYGPAGLRVWRNRGDRGFADVTDALGLANAGAVEEIVAADFDEDGDTDLVAGTPHGLRYWRNDGGNANRQLKLQLDGKRSNASALGVRIDVVAGNWRTSRTVRRLPVEIGTGNHAKLDEVRIHWFDLATSLVDVPVSRQPLVVVEPSLPSGSCPYLYAWDGTRFRFVTDILGAAPLGLPVSATHLIEADPEEYLALGDTSRFAARNGSYEVRVTDELREVLYLDEAQLVVVDHPAGTVVRATSKLHAAKPFPPHELWTLRPVANLRQAIRSDGLDVTAALARIDNTMVSPVHLRRPQLRGLAEPYSVTMDFGPLPVGKPLVLELTGWLRFGGGMANISASLDPTLPYPFPILDAELPDGSWKRVGVDVGAPCGKTKTILVDLADKLPPGTRRLRVTTAFEIYWDCATLDERVGPTGNQQTTLLPARADLHWRGFSHYADLPSSLPLTPEYDHVSATPPWDRTPSGWCTRYGSVVSLVSHRDDRLALLNGGDEVALSFPATSLPPPAPGLVRDYFLHVAGWDKDADFHVVDGWKVGPLPFRGMNDQAYGHESRPASLDSAWMREDNTRWVGPVVIVPPSKPQSIP